MKIDILSLFPEMFSALNCSLIGKAQQKGLVEINVIDFRQFSTDKHKKVDDYPFGGGAGMLLKVQPLFDAVNSIKRKNSKVILLSPRGRVYNQQIVKEYSKCEHLILVCGHYEGVDERFIELCVDEELSIGDFVLTGGEIPAMVVVDSVCRYIDGVLHNAETVSEESFSSNLLEYPQYTRPQEFMGLSVPNILISGNHQEVEKWRKEKSIEITKKRRPELLKRIKNE